MKKKRLIYQFHVDYSDRSKNVFGNSIDRKSLGEYWWQSKISAEIYAEKIGADYIFENPSEKDYKPFAFDVETFDKYRSIKFLENYDQVLYLDTDVLVLPHARNIFDWYKDQAFITVFFKVADKAMYKDTNHVSTGRLNTGIILFNRNRYVENEPPLHKMTIYSAHQPNINSKNEELLIKYKKGYWHEHWEKKHSDIVTYLKGGTISDENFFYRIIDIYGIPHYHLDRRWNYQPQFELGKENAQFMHFIEGSKKDMELYFMKYYSRFINDK